MNNIQNRYQELDALRGIAALMVVFFHFTMFRPEAAYGFNLGNTGVDLFFMISGFVIFMSLTKINNSRDFIINRVSRLYPTYWACVTFTFLLICLLSIRKSGDLSHASFIQYAANMTMFQSYMRIEDLDGPYWTMIVEMTFYIGILFLYRFRLLHYLTTIGICLSILAIALTYYSDTNKLAKYILIAIPLLHFIPLFLAGTIFYKIIHYKNKLVQNYTIVGLCFIAQLFLIYIGKPTVFITHNEYALMLVIYFTAFILFVNGKLGFIVSKGTLFLGKISFPLYLVHQFISIKCIIPLLTEQLHVNLLIACFFIALPIVLILAILITYYIEIPLSKKLKTTLQTVPHI